MPKLSPAFQTNASAIEEYFFWLERELYDEGFFSKEKDEGTLRVPSKEWGDTGCYLDACIRT